MGIGQRRPIQIRPYTMTKGGSGQNIESPGTPVNLWAEVLNPSSGRQFVNGQAQAESGKTFLIRYDFSHYPNINWRIMYDGKLYSVTGIEKDREKKFYYRLTATAKGYD